jgi:hypothetical protein
MADDNDQANPDQANPDDGSGDPSNADDSTAPADNAGGKPKAKIPKRPPMNVADLYSRYMPPKAKTVISFIPVVGTALEVGDYVSKGADWAWNKAFGAMANHPDAIRHGVQNVSKFASGAAHLPGKAIGGAINLESKVLKTEGNIAKKVLSGGLALPRKALKLGKSTIGSIGGRFNAAARNFTSKVAGAEVNTIKGAEQAVGNVVSKGIKAVLNPFGGH